MHFLISTDAVDRDNDTLDPKGWQLDSYKANPIVAFAHDYKSLPIAKCTSIAPTMRGLEATAEFPPKGVHAFADTVYDMLKAVDRGMYIDGIRLVEKSGGRSGTWRAS